jgi:hypothetical protein
VCLFHQPISRPPARPPQILSYDLERGVPGQHRIKTGSARPLFISPSGAFAASVERHSLLVWSCSPAQEHVVANFTHTRPYMVRRRAAGRLAGGGWLGPLAWSLSARHQARGTSAGPPRGPLCTHPPPTSPHTRCCLQCVAFDSRDQLLAAGDASGRIMLWHNFADALSQQKVRAHPSLPCRAAGSCAALLGARAAWSRPRPPPRAAPAAAAGG